MEGAGPQSSRPRYSIWTHPGVWMLLGFSYCTPGSFLAVGYSSGDWYLPASLVLVVIGVGIVWRGRGRQAAAGAFLLMAGAMAAGFVANLQLIYSGNWSWFWGLSSVAVIVGVGIVWRAGGWKVGTGAALLTVLAGAMGMTVTCAGVGVNWGLVVVC